MKTRNFSLQTLIISCAVLAFHLNINAQNGYPFVSEYTFDDAIENDNFDLVQDNMHNILIANRKGILTFDSRNWDLLPMPYSPITLAKSPSDGSIYVGCRNGFGRLELNNKGKYGYHLLSDTTFTGEISAIAPTSDRQYFLSRNQIFFSTGKDPVLKSWQFTYEHFLSGSFVYKNEFYFMVNELGLFKADADTFKLILSNSLTNNSELIFAAETDTKEILVGTDDNEILLFNGSGFTTVPLQDAAYIKASVITDGAYIGKNKIAVGSLMGGVVICDYKTGITSSILNYKTGLPDDEIYCMGTDANEGLWLCHSFGVSRVDNKINVTNLTWYPGLNGNLTNAAFFNGSLYVGTSDGLYSLDEKREYHEGMVNNKTTLLNVSTEKTGTGNTITRAGETPKQVQGTNKVTPNEPLSKRELRRKRREAQSGNPAASNDPSEQQAGILDKILSTVDNASRIFEKKPENEAYSNNKRKVYSLQVISHSYEKIAGVTGKCTEILNIRDHLLVSTNNGLYDVRNKQAKPVLPNTYINFTSTGPGDSLLFAGTNKSLYILLLQNDRWEVVREFDALDYPVYSACMMSPTELWLGSDNSAHKITIDAMFFADEDEAYPITTKFSDKVILKNINQQLYFFLSSGIFRMENKIIVPVKTFDNLESLPGYYFSNKNVVWYRSSGKWDFIADNSLSLNIQEQYLNIFQSVQDIYLGRGGNLWIVANNQEIFQVQKGASKMDSTAFSVFISGLKGTDNQLFPLVKPKISYQNSSIRIEFSAPYYIAPTKTEFTYKIHGLNEEWSPWSNVSTLEFPLLPPGAYGIEAKARNIFGEESEISRLDIVIKPPFWRTTIFYLFVIILVFVLFSLFVKFREKNLIKAKLILEQKVQERTQEIEMQKNEISEQKKEITDSILYAKRIQNAVLPSPSMLSSKLSEHFVLFLPRDIVSGDFYWSTIKGDKIVILAADCTGHGVPGAFMSMLGVSFLNEIVNAHKLDNAGSILDELREHVKATLAKSGGAEHARDGMDIALCILDLKQMKLQYAGAYNPLFMIREGELTEIKADKMPIGWYDLTSGFSNNVVNLRKGDTFYVFSDGFIDQFGGEMEKKFLSKQFKELLLKIHPQPMNKQKELLITAFENWKGRLQQVDDVLIIGFRI